jgi:hypothetical protein
MTVSGESCKTSAVFIHTQSAEKAELDHASLAGIDFSKGIERVVEC